MIHVVDYGMGNLGSILNMLKKIGVEARVSSHPSELAEARKLILPGIGAFDHGITRLTEQGLREVLDRKVLEEKVPILGICLGMQLFSRRSTEGKLPGLGWLPADTRRFEFDGADAALRVPHMGWNRVRPRPGRRWPASERDEWRFYFVHSYHVVCDSDGDILCTTPYGGEFTSGVLHGNIMGVQFHPEKSHRYGMDLLRAFAEW